MPSKVLKCIVEVEIHAITCPGVVLLNQEDVYLCVCVMGKYQKTKCVPPVFPLLFHEKMSFEKAFKDAVDPSDIADLLELDTAFFELIQLVPPAGETLATVVEHTREFLYPGPRLTPKYPGYERELLMKRSHTFPGIAPKVEFSTTSIITECDVKGNRHPSPPLRPTPVKPHCERKVRRSPAALSSASKKLSTCSYEQPTVASQSRSPSPYTKRRMCEMSEEARQRLHHLNLGPYKFKKETDSQPPFVVSCKPTAADNPPRSYQLSSTKRSPRQSNSSGLRVCEDPSLLGSYRPKTAERLLNPETSQASKRQRPSTSRKMTDGDNTRCSSPRRLPKSHSTPLSSKKTPPSPLLNRSSLKERFQASASSPNHWEEIHERVQKILQTHRTRQRLAFDEECPVREPGQHNASQSCEDSLCDSQCPKNRSVIPETSVHLDNGVFWSNRAAQYTGRNHRAVFEDSMEKIYRNLYKKASSTT
ncbi:spermatogenesis-associated protein 6 isoform X2 [Amia ocellicauda]|uniref:spermatogenesis-associated protein 6 isoform X2 n=1 Tax=Amia ocellicauda TaxID=2972642 RepID=UPI0034646CF9